MLVRNFNLKKLKPNSIIRVTLEISVVFFFETKITEANLLLKLMRRKYRKIK